MIDVYVAIIFHF